MINSKRFTIVVVIVISALLVVGNWTIPVQANGGNLVTPTPTGMPLVPPSGQAKPVSEEQQEELKSVIQAYFEIRYQALSISQPQGFRLGGFDDLVSDGPDVKPFLDGELGKLVLEIRYAELNHSRYMDYKYFLDFNNFSMDPVTQLVTILVVENNEFISENSAAGNPAHPHVAQMSGLKHTITLRKEQNRWRIVSDYYNDFLWRTIRQKGESTEETLNILNTMEAAPISARRYGSVGTEAASLLPDDPSSHAYDRNGAAQYARDHAAATTYNPNYPNYDDGENGDCTNFISQAIYEGGNASMSIPSPLPLPSPDGQSGWYLLSDLQRATDWNWVDGFYDFVIGYEYSTEGPEGSELGPVPEGQFPAGLMVGDVIQYERQGDTSWDHSAIVVGFDQYNGDPLVASHSPNIPSVNFRDVVQHVKTRFIHIERSDGYPPIKLETTVAADDAGGNPANICPDTNSDFGNNYFGGCVNGDNKGVTSGFLFRNVQIPPGAQIKYAYVTFTTDGPYTVRQEDPGFYYPISLQIYGENTVSPANFSSTNTPEDRTNLTSSFPWQIDGSVNGITYDTWDLGGRRTTPSIKDIIQSITGLNGWAYGNTLSLIFKQVSPPPAWARRVLGFERVHPDPDRSDDYLAARLIAAYDLSTPDSWLPIQESDPFYSLGTKDGWILESSETSEKGSSIDTGSMIFNLGDDAADKQYRSVLHFDTSILPDNAVITTVVLKIKKWGIFGTDPFTTHGSLNVDIREPYFGSNANLSKSDYEASATPGGMVGAGIFDPVPSDDWYTAILISTAFQYINRTGTTQFRLEFTLGDNDDMSSDCIFFYSGDSLIPEYRPQLIIYYYMH